MQDIAANNRKHESKREPNNVQFRKVELKGILLVQLGTVVAPVVAGSSATLAAGPAEEEEEGGGGPPRPLPRPRPLPPRTAPRIPILAPSVGGVCVDETGVGSVFLTPGLPVSHSRLWIYDARSEPEGTSAHVYEPCPSYGERSAREHGQCLPELFYSLQA
jgi:hypothetical protein